MTSTARKTATALAWLFVGKLSNMVLSFTATAVLARLLTPSDFGVMAVALLTMALPLAIFDGAFAIGVIQRREVGDDYLGEAFSASVLLGSALFIVVWAAAPWIEHFFQFHGLSGLIRLTSLGILFKGAANVPMALLQRTGRHRLVAAQAVIAYFFGYCLVGIGLALRGEGALSLCAASVVTAALEMTLALIACKVPFLRLMRWPHLQRSMADGGMLSVAQFFNWAANTGANIVVGRQLGAAQLGVYSRGWKLLDIATTALSAPIRQVMLPLFSRAQDDQLRLREGFRQALRSALFLFSLLSAWMVTNADAIVFIALGPKWTDTVSIATILFLALVPRCTFKVSEALAMSLGEKRAQAYKQLFYAVTMVSGAWAGTPWGGPGVSIGICVSIWCFYFVSVIHAGRLIQISLREIAQLHLTPLITAILTGLAMMALHRLVSGLPAWPHALISLVGGGLLTIGMMLCLPERLIGQFPGKIRRKIIGVATRRFLAHKP